MSDQLALLGAIAAAPDDDTPRLVYADYLDELGGAANAARAEFIRTQVEERRLPPADPRRKKLGRRAAALQKKHAAAWLPPFGKAFAASAKFEGGFVTVANLPAKSLKRTRPIPWHLEPVADVWVKGPAAAVLGALPALAGVYGLTPDVEDLDDGGPRFDFEAYDPDDPYEDPPDCPGDQLAAVVADLPGFAPLRSLSLSAVRVTDAGARSLAEAPHLRRLRELRLWWNWMTAWGWERLAESPVLDTVEDLDLSCDRSTDREDAGVPLPGNRGAEALADSPHLARVRVLKLDDSAIGKAGARALARSRHLAAVEELSLSALGWEADTLASLLQRDSFPRLRKLDLGQNELGREAAELLARSPLLARLTELDLGHNRIGPDAVAALLAAPDLSRLEDLNLMGTPVGDEGVELLARCDRLPALRRLCLSFTPLTARSVAALLRAPWVGRLEGLGLVRTGLPQEARDRLRKRLGKVVCFRY